MHVDRRVRASRASSLSTPPRDFAPPSCAHNLPPPLSPIVIRVFFAARAPAPSFPFLSPRGGRNRHFFVLALEPLSLKSSFLSSVHYSSTRPSLPVRYKWGTWLSQLYATHIVYGPRRSAMRGGRARSKTTSSVLRLRRNKFFFFFCFLFSLFHFSPPSFFFSLFPLPILVLFMLRA